MNRKKGRFWPWVYWIVLAAFTGYVALDTFIIPRSYTTVSTTTQAASSSSSSSSATSLNATTTATSYDDGNIKITVTTYREDDTSVYVADIQLSSAEYLKTAFASGTYGKNIKDTTSDIAESVSAILAINGDFYGARNSGYVIRNGVIYRSTSAGDDQQDLVVYSDGSMEVVSEGDYTAEELLAKGAEQVLSFGPSLIENGTVTVSKNEEVDQSMTSNPRTAIGMIDDLHYVLVVSDGRTDESAGLSLYELANFMQSLGVTTAYNLDGGGSSTMYFGGEVINNPTTTGSTIKERSVSDIVYIGY